MRALILLFASSLALASAPTGVRAPQAATGSPIAGACPDNGAAFVDQLSKPHWNGWGVDPSQHRFQPADMARLAPSDAPRLKLKWAFGFPGATRSVAQPTVFGGRVFVGGQNEKVYSLDAKSGCTYWEYGAGKGVRSAIVIGQRGDGWSAYFGDAGANVHSIDALTGKALWTTKVDDHPAAVITGSPTLVGTTLFVPVSSFEEVTGANKSYSCCTFRGSLVALDPSTGKILWKAFTIAAEAKSGAARAWTRQITSGDAYNVACAPPPARENCPKANGPDFDFGSSAVLANLSGSKRILIAGQKSGVVTALDPDNGGEIVWQKRAGKGSTLGGVQWGVAADESSVYVAVSDPKVSLAAPGTPGAQPLAFNPKVSLLLDSKAGGGLSALKLETGEEVWRTPHPGCGDVPGCSPAQSAAVTAIPGLVFSGGLDGRLRAYSTADGRIVWDMDTKGDYQTINGVAAKGGSIDGGGAVVVDGMVYVGSGSGFVGTMPGNVLLAYSVDGL